MKINHVGQEIFNSTNFIMPHQFVQNKFVQEFVAISLLIFKMETFIREKLQNVTLMIQETSLNTRRD